MHHLFHTLDCSKPEQGRTSDVKVDTDHFEIVFFSG